MDYTQLACSHLILQPKSNRRFPPSDLSNCLFGPATSSMYLVESKLSSSAFLSAVVHQPSLLRNGLVLFSLVEFQASFKLHNIKKHNSHAPQARLSATRQAYGAKNIQIDHSKAAFDI
ncbi:hypothetical protein CERZMDRAFT_103218 [Cercospora zeae-maydis SCOH1-5]|uniref:Uncharacterized protein n=1 Tax=Cercospora zeae-maydis SCOH1-5 TaxID=717836 RepID=A0A6A6F1Z0_9PEZI|nr:hypothetical protein CERZMDRAFT_103218 [Cercospora zeae-maydis SCOH1-5]